MRLHLGGFFWGDRSLSNTLFRRDAGALAAYLVDAETSEAHPKLSEAQRLHDLAIAEDNIIGELMDVEAEIGLPSGLDPEATGAEVRERYTALWAEVAPVDTFAQHERFRIDERLRRSAGLILLCVQPRQRVQTPAMVARLDDVRV